MLHSHRIFVFDLKQLTKILACIYVLVSKVLLPLEISNGIVAFSVLLLLTICVLSSYKMNIRLNDFLYSEIVFLVITIALSVFVSRNEKYLFEATYTLFCGFLFGFCMICITKEEKSITWFVKSWLLACIILVLYLFFTGGYSVGKLNRLSLNEGFNTNTLGVFFMFGIWGVLYYISDKAKKNTIKLVDIFFSIICTALFLFVIIRTGSRKALIASLFIIAFWVIFGLLSAYKNISVGKRVAMLFLAGTIIIFIYFRFGKIFHTASETIMYRMGRLSEESVNDTIRYELIVDALKVFLKHPLLGVGWNNYKVFSIYGVYSHNTFTELLACTGVVGTFFSIPMWFFTIKNIVAAFKRSNDKAYKVCVICLFVSFLFIEFVQIVYYNSSLLMIMHLLVAITLIEHPETKRSN